MNTTVSSTLRNSINNRISKGNLRAYLRKIVPTWQLLSNTASGYIEEPDNFDGSAIYGAGSNYQESFAATNAAIAGDSVWIGTSVYRALQPTVWGDTAKLVYFYSSNTLTASAYEYAVSSIQLLGNDEPVVHIRGGMYGGSTASFFYLTPMGVRKIDNILVPSNGSTYANTARYVGITAGSICPVAENSFFVIWTKADKRVIYLDYYKDDGYVFTDKVIGYNNDETPRPSTLTWCDAEAYYDKYVIVFNQGAMGASRYVVVTGESVGTAREMVSFDNVAWTSTIRIASLSVIHNRLYAFAGQKFLNGDDTYSSEIWSPIWTNDLENWAQPDNLSVGTKTCFGKLIPQNDKILLVSPTTVMYGDLVSDFGGFDVNVQTDISFAVRSITFSKLADGTGTNIIITVDVADSPYINSEYFRTYPHIVVFRIESGNENAILGLGWILDPIRSISYSTDTVTIMARGSLSKMLSKIQFTDDLVLRAEQVYNSLEYNSIINRAGSIWKASGGVLSTDISNDDGELLATLSAQFHDGFVLYTRFQYQEQTQELGVIFFAGVPQYMSDELLSYKDDNGDFLYLPDELSEYNYWFVKFSPSNGKITPYLGRRVSTKSTDGTWTSTDYLFVTGSDITLAKEEWYEIWINYNDGWLKVYGRKDGGYWAEILSYQPQIYALELPENYLLGLYAKNISAKVSESYFAGVDQISTESLDEWPVSGNVKINDHVYSYSKNGDVLELTAKTNEYISKGTKLTLDESDAVFDEIMAATSNKRYSVADIIRHTSIRSGIALSVDNLVDPLSEWEKNTALTLTADGYVFLSGGYAVSDKFVSDCKIKVSYSSLSGSLSVIKSICLNTDGTLAGEIGVKINRGMNEISVLSASGNMAKIPVYDLPLSGTAEVIFHEGFAHIYINDRYYATIYDAILKNDGLLTIGGNGVTVSTVVLEAGYEVTGFGIWAGQTPARNFITRVLSGLNYLLTEKEDITLRLQHTGKHDDLGSLEFNTVKKGKWGHQEDLVPTAVVANGAETWMIVFHDDAINEHGLVWQTTASPFLTTTRQIQEKGLEYLETQNAYRERFEFTGVFDPAIQINDQFTVSNNFNESDGIFIVDSITLENGFMMTVGAHRAAS